MSIISPVLAAARNELRLAALRKTALLDTPAEEAFDRFTRLVCRSVGVPIALISLVDADRLFFKSAIGIPEQFLTRREAPLSHSLCPKVVATGAPVLVEDVRLGRRGGRALAVRVLGGTAYLGVPLITSDGYPLGSLCAMDDKFRGWGDADTAILKDLAALIMTEIGSRSTSERASQAEAFRFQANLLESLGPAAIATDPHDIIRYWNPSAEIIYGWSASEALGRHIMELLPADSSKDEIAAIRERVRAGDSWFGELAVQRRGGTTFPAIVSESPVYDASSELAGIVGISADISDQKRKEEQSRTITEAVRPKAVPNGAGDWQWNIMTGGVACSSHVEALHGIAEGSFAGTFEAYQSLIHAEDRARVLKTIRQNVEERRPHHVDYRVTRAGGEVRWVELRAHLSCDAQGRPTGMAGTCTDVTERKDAELALHSANRKLQAVIEGAPLAIMVTGGGTGNKVQIWNPIAEELFGWRADEAIGRPPRIVPDDKVEEDRMLQEALRRGEQVTALETQRRRKDGSRFDVTISAAQLGAVKGEGRRLMFVMADVSERRRVEEQLRLADKMQTIGRLIGGVAHDFNNQLTAIQGHTDLLFEDLEPAGPHAAGLAAIRNAAERAGSLTQQLLAFSRMQVQRPRVLDLSAVITETKHALQPLLGADIELSVILSPSPGRVKADRAQIEQIFRHLALNARDAMPNGGTLTIETAEAQLDSSDGHQVPIAPGRYVRIVVTDTGCGMDEETRARCLELFFTTKEKSKGIGLGLSAVYGIVKQSGGYVWVESAPNKGTTITIHLPRVDAPAETEPVPASALDSPASARPDSATVLLVEEDESVRSLMRMVLRKKGHAVLEVRNAADAAVFCETYSDPIHLIITDAAVSGMSGSELAERATEMRPDVKFLYLSSYADYDPVDRGALASNTASLQKPFSAGALVEKVREVLSLTTDDRRLSDSVTGLS